MNSYKEDIDCIFLVKEIITKELKIIDNNNLYSFVFKKKSLGYLYSYFEIYLEKHINYSKKNKNKLIEYLFSSLFKEYEETLKTSLYRQCICLKNLSDKDFLYGYEKSDFNRPFIQSSDEHFFFWNSFLKDNF